MYHELLFDPRASVFSDMHKHKMVMMMRRNKSVLARTLGGACKVPASIAQQASRRILSSSLSSILGIYLGR